MSLHKTISFLAPLMWPCEDNNTRGCIKDKSHIQQIYIYLKIICLRIWQVCIMIIRSLCNSNDKFDQVCICLMPIYYSMHKEIWWIYFFEEPLPFVITWVFQSSQINLAPSSFDIIPLEPLRLTTEQVFWDFHDIEYSMQHIVFTIHIEKDKVASAIVG